MLNLFLNKQNQHNFTRSTAWMERPIGCSSPPPLCHLRRRTPAAHGRENLSLASPVLRFTECVVCPGQWWVKNSFVRALWKISSVMVCNVMYEVTKSVSTWSLDDAQVLQRVGARRRMIFVNFSTPPARIFSATRTFEKPRWFHENTIFFFLFTRVHFLHAIGLFFFYII